MAGSAVTNRRGGRDHDRGEGVGRQNRQEPRGSRVDGRGSRVEGRGSRVEGRGSRVEGRGSRVEGRCSMVDGRWSMVDGRRLAGTSIPVASNPSADPQENPTRWNRAVRGCERATVRAQPVAMHGCSLRTDVGDHARGRATVGTADELAIQSPAVSTGASTSDRHARTKPRVGRAATAGHSNAALASRDHPPRSALDADPG
jgi:hypothetical protein